jgi:2-dehydropantoate 2-reductase
MTDANHLGPQLFDKIAVMGAGAVGCYFGAMLARAGAHVELIGRKAHVDAIAKDGLLLDSLGHSQRVRFAAATTEPAGARVATLVLFCVKSAGTETAARALAPYLRADAVVLDLQNGVDNVDRMRPHIRNAIVPAVVYVAAEMTGPGALRHGGRGDLVIGVPGAGMSGDGAPAGGTVGPDQALVGKLAAFLAGAGIPTRISDDVIAELWTKLVVNCAYNALSALGRSRYGPMLALPAARHGRCGGGDFGIGAGEQSKASRRSRRDDAQLRECHAGGHVLDGPGPRTRTVDRDRLPQRLCGARMRRARIAGAGKPHPLRGREASRTDADGLRGDVGARGRRLADLAKPMA